MLKGICPFIWVFFSLLLSVHTSTAQAYYSSSDTIRIDINQSYFDGSDVEVPVTIHGSSVIYAVDLAIRFNGIRIQFDSLTNVLNGLQYLYYSNPNDSIWRITSYHPLGIQPGSTVFNLRFITFNNEVCVYDFSDQEAFINGDSSAIEIIGCMDNLGLPNQEFSKLARVYPNPFSDQLFIEPYTSRFVQIFDYRGTLLMQTGTQSSIDTRLWPAGIYFVSFLDNQRRYSYKLLKP